MMLLKWLTVMLLILILAGITYGAGDSKTIQAKEVVYKIKLGQPVEYDGCTIIGELNLSRLEISEPIRFDNTIFQNTVNFNYTRFNNSADFSYSKFNSPAYFMSSQFNGSADFRYSKFNRLACFSYSKFNSYADFIGSKFNSIAYFSYSKFNGSANFRSSQFNYTAFEYSKFNSSADFSYSKFNSYTDFIRSEFSSYADFAGSKFNNFAYFESSKFNNSANFTASHFSKDAYFLNSYINSLDLSATYYEKINIRWSSINSLVYDKDVGDTAYQLLIENFRKLGFLSDADNCYYQFRKEQCLNRDPLKDPFMFLLDLGGWIFYGYGKKPLYPLEWSAVSILVFGIFWYIAGMKGKRDWIDEYSLARDQVINEDSEKPGSRLGSNIWHKSKLALRPFFFSATIFLSGTRLFIEPPDPPELPELSVSLVKGMLVFERALGAFFSILLLLAISGTVVR